MEIFSSNSFETSFDTLLSLISVNKKRSFLEAVKPGNGIPPPSSLNTAVSDDGSEDVPATELLPVLLAVAVPVPLALLPPFTDVLLSQKSRKDGMPPPDELICKFGSRFTRRPLEEFPALVDGALVEDVELDAPLNCNSKTNLIKIR